LESEKVKPPEGAGSLIVTTATIDVPPVTLAGLTTIDERDGAATQTATKRERENKERSRRQRRRYKVILQMHSANRKHYKAMISVHSRR
jgi:hypothetical protein